MILLPPLTKLPRPSHRRSVRRCRRRRGRCTVARQHLHRGPGRPVLVLVLVLMVAVLVAVLVLVLVLLVLVRVVMVTLPLSPCNHKVQPIVA